MLASFLAELRIPTFQFTANISPRRFDDNGENIEGSFSAMSIEGHLNIDLHESETIITKAVITSSRPVQIAGLFNGKTAEEALKTIPLIFSVCARAQSFAGVLACERAMGLPFFEDTCAARQIIVLTETAREHVLRIALDWPSHIVSEADNIDVKPIMKLPKSMQQGLFASGQAFKPGARAQIDAVKVEDLVARLSSFLERQIFGEDLALWSTRVDIDTLKVWADSAGTIPARLVSKVIKLQWAGAGNAGTAFLPSISDKEMLANIKQDDDGAYRARPTWNLHPCETSCLSRQLNTPLINNLHTSFGNGLLTRLTARLCELASLPDEMRQLLGKCLNANKASRAQEQHMDGYGLAQIEAARGRLVHMVQTDRERIKDYRILSPTEWNFHPDGPAARALVKLDAGNKAQLKQQAKLLITAIDPCIGYELRVC